VQGMAHGELPGMAALRVRRTEPRPLDRPIEIVIPPKSQVIL
jgi:hypothetical protein